MVKKFLLLVMAAFSLTAVQAQKQVAQKVTPVEADPTNLNPVNSQDVLDAFARQQAAKTTTTNLRRTGMAKAVRRNAAESVEYLVAAQSHTLDYTFVYEGGDFSVWSIGVAVDGNNVTFEHLFHVEALSPDWNPYVDEVVTGVYDADAKTVTIPAVATGYNGESSIHFLVNENGSNAEKAHFTTAVTNHELFDALESLGATHGDNIAVEDTEGTIEGSDLKIEVIVDGASYAPADLVAGADPRPDQPRFGGNIDLNDEYGTGCLFCMESCSLGITSNAAYEYTEPMEFTPTDNMPAANTPVTIVYTVL